MVLAVYSEDNDLEVMLEPWHVREPQRPPHLIACGRSWVEDVRVHLVDCVRSCTGSEEHPF